MPPRRTLRLAGLLTTAAGIALFIWLIWTTGPRTVWDGFRQVGWGLAAIIAIAGHAVRCCAPSAWIRCLEPPHTLRRPEAFAAVVSGDALGNATPLGPLVSEPAKVALVRTRVPLGVAFTALAVENVFYTLSVAAVIAAGTIALLLRGGIASNVRLAAEIAIGVVLADLRCGGVGAAAQARAAQPGDRDRRPAVGVAAIEGADGEGPPAGAGHLHVHVETAADGCVR